MFWHAGIRHGMPGLKRNETSGRSNLRSRACPMSGQNLVLLHPSSIRPKRSFKCRVRPLPSKWRFGPSNGAPVRPVEWDTEAWPKAQMRCGLKIHYIFTSPCLSLGATCGCGAMRSKRLLGLPYGSKRSTRLTLSKIDLNLSSMGP